MLNYLLLALLTERPRHGYELHGDFEHLFGGMWPVNMGQVYATLTRLEKQGLVEHELISQDQLPDRKEYSLTSQGWTKLTSWMAQPVGEALKLKNEFFAKVVAHAFVDHGDPVSLLWQQRQHCLETLAQLVRLRDDPDAEPVLGLLLEGAIMHAEADLRWLDLCEARLSELKRG